MNLKGEMIGDENGSEQEIEEALRRVENMPRAMDNGAEKLIDRAKSIAKSKGLHKTGAGVAGIIYEPEKFDRLIGWAPRPNFHLYFHEIGTYKDYPRPHVRPAADQTEHEIVEDIRKMIIGD